MESIENHSPLSFCHLAALLTEYTIFRLGKECLAASPMFFFPADDGIG
jgi:hypothetical protein